MRRITVFEADDVKAHAAVIWLNQNGYDIMAEDYREPTLQRRHPPERTVAPERTEPSVGLLRPLKTPVQEPEKNKRGRKAGPVTGIILMWLKDAGLLSLSELKALGEDHGTSVKVIRDALRRMAKSGKVVMSPDGKGYHLPKE